MVGLDTSIRLSQSTVVQSMSRRSLFFFSLATLSLIAVPALADVAPDPCEGQTAGDACQTFNGKVGVCTASGASVLTCEQPGAGGAGAGGGTTSAGGAIAGVSTTSGGTTPAKDNESCRVSQVGTSDTSGVGIGFGLFVWGMLSARRRRRG